MSDSTPIPPSNAARALAPEAMRALQAAVTKMIDASSNAEAEARHWYRMLLGDKMPRYRADEHYKRRFLQHFFPDNPGLVERELLSILEKSALHADAHCWGPDYRYLEEALAAHCGIGRKQFLRMTFPEIAEALKGAYEREQADGQLAQARAREPIPTGSSHQQQDAQRGGEEASADGRPSTPTADYCLLTGYRVRWKKEMRLQPLLWNILNCLLSQELPFPVGELEDAAWGKDVASKTVANALSRLNNALVEDISFPWTWHVHNGHVWRDG